MLDRLFRRWQMADLKRSSKLLAVEQVKDPNVKCDHDQAGKEEQPQEGQEIEREARNDNDVDRIADG